MGHGDGGGDGLMGVTHGGDGGGVGHNGGGGLNGGVSPLDDGGGLAVVDDGLTLYGDRVGHGVGLVDVDGDGHLLDLLPVDGHVVGHVVGPVDVDRLVHLVDLLLDLDDGGVLADGSLEDGGHLNGQNRRRGLQDLGLASGDELGLAEVELLGHDGGLLVDGGHGGSLLGGGVRGRHGDGGGQGGVGHGHGCGVVGGGGAGSGKHGGQNNLQLQFR